MRRLLGNYRAPSSLDGEPTSSRHEYEVDFRRPAMRSCYEGRANGGSTRVTVIDERRCRSLQTPQRLRHPILVAKPPRWRAPPRAIPQRWRHSAAVQRRAEVGIRPQRVRPHGVTGLSASAGTPSRGATKALWRGDGRGRAMRLLEFATLRARRIVGVSGPPSASNA